MKTLLLFFLTFTFFSLAQTNTYNYEFKFYKNGSFPKTKKLNVYALSGSDTIQCIIKEDKISIPKLSDIGSMLINFRNKTYQIDDIDFSKLSKKGSLFIGIENNMKNFVRPLPKETDFYMHKDYAVILQLKNYKSIKKICFINYSFLKSIEGDRASTSNYARYSIL